MDKLSTTVLRKRRTSRSVYMLRHRQFTLMTHLRVARANANSVAQHTHSGKKGQSVGASLLASSMENLASSVKLQQ
ncbi:hypothetical protein CsSME_00014510 [Camellia sinensis var. sinensis]